MRCRNKGKWANFFVLLLGHLTPNQFTLKDSFGFAEIICEQDAGLFIASLDFRRQLFVYQCPS